ncbi:putative Fe-S cluster assembly protein SufT [Aquabacterium sp.]|uniref:putative Fe-S cluster assembly protein SufT n=1 Tax=Aquabacterium sp. TaxID=1872578 RepID=UPI0037842FC9
MRPLREPVVTTRAVRVECIPDGRSADLPPGTPAQITQALGGSFTLWVEGQLMRLRGVDADAIGKPVPDAAVATAGSADIGPDELRALVWQTLKTCYDPEIPVDIVELGLVYVCEVLPMEDEGTHDGAFRVAIQMTLTAPGCGMGAVIADEVCDKLLALPGVGEATVDIVFEPPWNRSMMSEAAMLTLGL